MNIQLTGEELLELLLEKTIEKDDITISSNASFLLVMSLLDSKMAKRPEHANTK